MANPTKKDQTRQGETQDLLTRLSQQYDASTEETKAPAEPVTEPAEEPEPIVPEAPAYEEPAEAAEAAEPIVPEAPAYEEPVTEPENPKNQQEVLERLSATYNAARVEAEKRAMEELDRFEESDEKAPDVIAYEEPEAEKAAEPMPEEPTAPEMPAFELPEIQTLKFEEPAAEEPVVESLVYEEPATEAPVYETSAVEAPVYEEPAVETPVYETPAVETPVYEEPAVETPIAEEAEAPAPTEAEIRELLEKYLGAHRAAEATPASYDSVHQQILDAEKKSGMTQDPLPDINENIQEAAKYVDELTARTGEEKRVTTDEFPTSGEESAERIAAYEPAAARAGRPPEMPDRIYTPDDADTKETPAIPEPNTDTKMLRAFGLDPRQAPSRREEPFKKFSFNDTSELQSTEEISLRELDEMAQIPEPDPKAVINDFEYTSATQNKRILSIFKSKYSFSKVRMILAGLFAMLLLVVENFASVEEAIGNRMAFVALDWFLAFASVLLISDRIGHALQCLGHFRFDTDTIPLVAFLFSIASTATALLLTPAYEDVHFYNFPLAFCVLMDSIGIFISLRRDVYSFKIVSSARVKRAICHMKPEASIAAPEQAAFSGYLGSESELCEMKKADFVSDFFARRKEHAKSKTALAVLVPLCLAVSVAFFFVAYKTQEATVTESIGTAYAAFMMCAPFAAFLSYTYPMYLASRRAYAYNAAILGDNAPEDYRNAAVVTFRDEDAFPAGKIKVKRIKIYAERNIESVIYYASSVFSAVGGPLATVFKQATLNSVNSDAVELREISDGGIHAMVDGKSIVIGRPDYMEAQCFETLPDTDDIDFTQKSNKRILYLACDHVIIAKFYIQYNTTSDFIYIVRHLVDTGICVSVRTSDPALDSDVLYDNKLDPKVYPIKIVKTKIASEKTPTVSAKDASVISVGTAKDTIKTLLLCDRLRNVRKTNLALKIISMLLGAAVMALVLLTGKATGMSSVYPVLYQLFWIFPFVLVSKIYI